MKNTAKQFLIVLFTFINVMGFAQVKPKLKWKDFLGTWDSKETFDKAKGQTKLSFDKHKADADMNSIQTIWKFAEDDVLYYIKKYADKENDTTVVKWFYVKAKNTVQLRQQVNMGGYFMIKDLHFLILEMQDDKMRLQLME
ncbi:MAG: hypothetical protein K0S33_1135 [Bacteroidetes bacterium]|jgi:hypothetical protein|nr:hypothetical protein [Bacteroidota bacterium]